ncbi:hypothetical protein KRP22_004989 [Phytophthora ramorum]|uniref:uncharacterized protein n=1 Tax=Phytophthora ramorum TaxID=164328 RepID=UPI0030A46AED|nr:hypothetical protein KRP23_13589 [Phytophthora ramorum]KAH7497510.1 hypothetical protein KRP22_12573 [Phytophthora ramorum]
MPKRVHDENEADNTPTDDPPSKAAKSSAACEFCGKTFTTRGMSRHHSSCSKKRESDKAVAKRTRSYNFMILNAGVFQTVLSFLGNQTLTKLQMISGENYPQCEPQLARYCCKCENDNPVILQGLCRQCESQLDSYMPRTIKEIAKNNYGVKDQDFHSIPCEVRKRYTLFDRITLENHMIRTCGSKMRWVRYLAKKDCRKKKLNATLRRKDEEADAFLEQLAPGFAEYVSAIGFKKRDKELFKPCSRRFVELKAALGKRGLTIRSDSRLCKDYITAGHGNIGSVVDTMEEMNFLFTHTDYPKRCENKIDRIRSDEFGDFHMWYPRVEYRDMLQGCRDEAKIELCVEYLGKNDKGLKLPRKWENCRQRYEKIVVSGGNPQHKKYKIYRGEHFESEVLLKQTPRHSATILALWLFIRR